jgi:hypothetical protein
MLVPVHDEPQQYTRPARDAHDVLVPETSQSAGGGPASSDAASDAVAASLGDAASPSPGERAASSGSDASAGDDTGPAQPGEIIARRKLVVSVAVVRMSPWWSPVIPTTS